MFLSMHKSLDDNTADKKVLKKFYE